MLAWCHDHGRVIAQPRGRYEGQEEDPHVANDAEVSVLAGHLSLMAIDLLIPRDPSVYPHSAYLLGFRAEWILTRPSIPAPSMWVCHWTIRA